MRTLTNGQFQGQTAIPGPIAMRRLGIEGIPVFTVENACAAGSSAFNLATLALRAGSCDIALAVGAEKMNIADKARMFAAFDGGWDVSTVDENKATLLAIGEGVVPPPGSMSEKPYSVFMDVYAALCRHHMKTYGTTQRQIAAVAAKNHQHSVHNPLAQFRDAYSIEQVLAAPPIAYPVDAADVFADQRWRGRSGALQRRRAASASTARAIAPSRCWRASCRPAARAASTSRTKTSPIWPRAKPTNRPASKRRMSNVAEVHDATAMGEILNAEALMLVALRRRRSGRRARRLHHRRTHPDQSLGRPRIQGASDRRYRTRRRSTNW